MNLFGFYTYGKVMKRIEKPSPTIQNSKNMVRNELPKYTHTHENSDFHDCSTCFLLERAKKNAWTPHE